MSTNWNREWHNYRGRVRVVLDDTSVVYGRSVGTTVNGDRPSMLVRLTCGKEGWHHPRHVYPVRDYDYFPVT